jgi:hypothetical protein
MFAMRARSRSAKSERHLQVSGLRGTSWEQGMCGTGIVMGWTCSGESGHFEHVKGEGKITL